MLEAARRGEILPENLVHALGEECPADFFRIVIESLADSFDVLEHEFVMAADEQDITAVVQGSQLTDHVDGIGLTERQIEDDAFRRCGFKRCQHCLGG